MNFKFDSTKSQEQLKKEYWLFLQGKMPVNEAVLLDEHGIALKPLPCCPLARSITVYERAAKSIIKLAFAF